MVIINIDENSRMYGVLLSILTGIVASIGMAIMMELYNNYNFNCKRQRELREYFAYVVGYQLEQWSLLMTDAEHESPYSLGEATSYATFRWLDRIILSLREALDKRDYLDSINTIYYVLSIY